MPNSPDNENKFGGWFRDRRISSGFPTPKSFAEHVFASQGEYVVANDVSQLESGRIKLPRQPRLGAYATALGVTQVEFLQAAGLITEDVTASTNPFEVTDPRHDIVELLPQLSDRTVLFLREQMVFIAEHYDQSEPSVEPTENPPTL